MPLLASIVMAALAVHVPAGAGPVNTSHPTRVVGNGNARSCTSAAVVAAVRAGGVIHFSCGPRPVVITMRRTAKVVNTSREVVLDGGGNVTLSGGGRRRILYMDTCDPKQVWTTAHCQDQSSPRLVVQNITFAEGNSTDRRFDGGGGGAIYNDGDRMTLSIGGSVFTGNHANEGGSAIFFVSNDRTGTMAIRHSSLEHNPNERFHTPGLPGIYFLGARRPTISHSTLKLRRGDELSAALLAVMRPRTCSFLLLSIA
ncbi:MAG TPA: hypothetical protein VFI54_09495 [Solirubrobacteraceae bacterium]|nr:hypothetical protein [Solirubrobacteraceae bacterium]